MSGEILQLFILFVCFENAVPLGTFLKNIPRFENQYYNEDARYTAPQIITNYGYPNEVHRVTTEDGYILELHRILPRNSTKPPILLMHPLLCSSAEYILNGPGKSLAFILADQGYDVWIGNARGNTYSRKHINLDPNSSQFWDFSFHEMGYYDAPAFVDYILKATGSKRLHYAGHSQGGLVFFIMCSMRPEYNDKVLSMTGFAPAVYISHVRSPIIRSLDFLGRSPAITLRSIKPFEFLPRVGDELFSIVNFFCNEMAITQPLCFNAVFLIVGFSQPRLNTSMLMTYFGHSPAGSSIYQIVHLVQFMISGEFKRMDYGFVGNVAKYGSPRPPKYDISRVTPPISLFCGPSDLLVSCQDVKRLASEIKNLIIFKKVALKNFNHMDFLLAKDANVLLYKDAINVIERFNKI